MLDIIFSDYTFRIVSLGSVLLGIVSGVLGSFAVIRKQSLLGDAVSHSALPGIAIAFLFTFTKRTEVLLLGALISGLVSTFLILNITKYSRVKFDSALALILSVFFGFGMVLLTYIQKVPNANQAGLEKFIFGQASTLIKRDVIVMAILGGILLLGVLIFWKEFKLVSFDEEYAESLGYPTRKITAVLFFMIVTAIIIGLQTVGVILMSALLVTPGVAARQWTDKLSVMVLLSALFGAISGVVGTIFSSFVSKLPTGPMIVIIISIIVFISLTLAPRRGLVWKYFRDKNNEKNIHEDQILVNLYQLNVAAKDDDHSFDVNTIRPNPKKNKTINEATLKSLARLSDKALIKEKDSNHWVILPEGKTYIEKYYKEGEE